MWQMGHFDRRARRLTWIAGALGLAALPLLGGCAQVASGARDVTGTLVDSARDSDLADQVRNSDLFRQFRRAVSRVRDADVLDQIRDSDILNQIRDDGSLPALPTDAANCTPPYILSAEWGRHDGGRSLAVSPSDCVRTNGLGMIDRVWNSLIKLDPSANEPGMRDQLICHMVGAQTKDTWNLEPWRRDVGLRATLLAACNP